MRKPFKINCGVFLLAVCLITWSGDASAAFATEQKPITLKTMGSLYFGGTVAESSNGGTFHADHGYAQYYIPLNSRNYPLVMWHGIGQSGKTYESTPDGREGYQAIFARRDWPVYIIDQPRRGRVGRTQAGPNTSIPPVLAAEYGAWNAFREAPGGTRKSRIFIPAYNSHKMATPSTSSCASRHRIPAKNLGRLNTGLIWDRPLLNCSGQLAPVS